MKNPIITTIKRYIIEDSQGHKYGDVLFETENNNIISLSIVSLDRKTLKINGESKVKSFCDIMEKIIIEEVK